MSFYINLYHLYCHTKPLIEKKTTKSVNKSASFLPNNRVLSLSQLISCDSVPIMWCPSANHAAFHAAAAP